ncbi:CAP domain-containing protein [Metabacillus idriensis]|uniref:CAP domain-containing protein n=1 Tax=Metabacillus idriensis TaxID=324768 RepID=UPI00204018BD|nr:CAP domain-containing protein [Metabacillus idriensis]MCM3594620.1 CAP domain-containing protein [Metabacillus idriensis]
MKKSFVLSVAAAATIFTFNAGGPSADAAAPQQSNMQVKAYQIAGQNCNLNQGQQQELLKNINNPELQKMVEQQLNQFKAQQGEAAAQAPQKEQAEAPKQEAAPAPAQKAQPEASKEADPKQEQTQASVSEFEKKVVELTNAEREKQGLKPLQLDEELSKVAKEKSKDMQSKNYFDHNSPTYGSPFDMMKKFGVEYTTAGENIAKGQASPEEVVQAWMNSEGHRKNIMNGDFTHIGVGHVAEGNYWTQMFIGK